MPVSPWMANDQGAYTIPGYPQLLMQRNAETAQAWQNIGQFAGALGAGVVGAQQGASDPTQFNQNGQTPSTASAGLQGFLMNFNNANNGGTGTSGFGRLVQNGGGPATATATGGGGMNMKQFAALGKTADALRESMASNPSNIAQAAVADANGGQQPAVMGFTDDQWKHLGTADKVNALQSWKQQQDARTMMQGYDIGQAHLASVLQQNAQKDAWQTFAKNFNPTTATDPNTMLKAQLQAGIDPRDAMEFNRGAMDLEKGQKDLTGADNVPQGTTIGPNNTPVIYNKRTGQFQVDPSYTAQQKFNGQKQLLDAKLTGIPAADQLKSLDAQEKIVRSDLFATEEEKQGKLAVIAAKRNALMGGAGGAAKAPAVQANPADVQWLKSNPSAARVATFEKQYGKGAAAQILQAQQ